MVVCNIQKSLKYVSTLKLWQQKSEGVNCSTSSELQQFVSAQEINLKLLDYLTKLITKKKVDQVEGNPTKVFDQGRSADS